MSCSGHCCKRDTVRLLTGCNSTALDSAYRSQSPILAVLCFGFIPYLPYKSTHDPGGVSLEGPLYLAYHPYLALPLYLAYHPYLALTEGWHMCSLVPTTSSMASAAQMPASGLCLLISRED